jgi:hypothetical protein
VSSTQYYLLCLAAGLVFSATASAIFTWQMRRRELRRLHAAQLLDALARYSEWVAAQGRVVFFQDDTQEADDPVLQEVSTAQRQWFPELRAEAEQLYVVHRRLVEFLSNQRKLRLRDFEAWLDSDQDAGYMQLWQQHCWAVQALEQRLVYADGIPAPAA